MRIAMLSPMTGLTLHGQHGTWESVIMLLTKGLVRSGVDLTLFTTRDIETGRRFLGVNPEGSKGVKGLLPRIIECLNISEVFERGDEFDLIHNLFDYLPLTYMNMTSTPMLTTIQGLYSTEALPFYKKYNGRTYYVAVSKAGKSQDLDYIATIPHGIDLDQFTFRADPGDYLLFFGRIHHEKGTRECIDIAQSTGMKLVIAGTVQDESYFEYEIEPFIDDDQIVYAGIAGPEKRNDLLGGAYALLHPINFDEAFGVSVIEAMACGTPVISINRGSMPELIADQRTGFLVESAEEMAEAISRVKGIDRGACRRWVEEGFSADRMVDDYVRIYERIIAERKREDHRPWGFYKILSDLPDHKVKRITVYPGHRLSYQRHLRRSEHWYILFGRAVVTKNGQEIELGSGEAIDVPVGTWHRVKNPGEESLVFIEVQSGNYFGEDDIERSEDDYGRV